MFDTWTDLSFGGGPVRIYRGGTKGKPPVVLLHGAMLDTGRGVWRDVAPALADEFDVVVPDLPRHGGSRRWRGILDDAFMSRWLADLLDCLGLDRVALVGLSLGGAISLRFALDHPSRVVRLVAMAPGGLEERRPFQLATWAALRMPGLMRGLTWYLARSPKAIGKTMRSHLTAGEQTPAFDSIVSDAVGEARAKHAASERALDDWQLEAYGPFRMRTYLTPELSDLEVPSLWLWGSQDPLVSESAIRSAQQSAPRSAFATIADAGHVMTYDQPEAVIRHVKQFLLSD